MLTSYRVGVTKIAIKFFKLDQLTWKMSQIEAYTCGCENQFFYHQKYPSQLRKMDPSLHEIHPNDPKMVLIYSQYINMDLQIRFGPKNWQQITKVCEKCVRVCEGVHVKSMFRHLTC